jgi:hypothetical protein
MEIFDFSSQRWKVAFDRFRDGESLVFRGVAFILDGAAGLCVQVVTSWRVENTTETTARRDFERAEHALSELLASSAEFASLVMNRHVRFVLVDDYATGSVALCRSIDGTLTWAHGLPHCLDE